MHRLHDTLSSLVQQGHIAGAAALVYQRGRVLFAEGVGQRCLERGLPVERDTLFRVASMSKPVTTLAALALYDEGRFDLDDPISRWAPEFSAPRVLRDPRGPIDDVEPARRPITWRDLLTHRSGIPYGSLWPGPLALAFADALGGDLDTPLAPDAWIAALGALPLVAQPGEAFHYGHSTDLLGLLLARIEGEPLEAVLQRRVFGKLGMHDTMFIVPEEKRARCAASTGYDGSDRPAPRRGGPGGSFVEDRPAGWTYVSGGQGLWSTVDDYLAFARTFLGENPILRPETLALMTSDQLTREQRLGATLFGMPLFGAGHGYGCGLAVVIDADKAAPSLCGGHVGSVGWPGAFGGWWQADPVDGSVMILLTHAMVEPGQLAAGLGLGGYVARAAFHRAASDALRPLS